MSIKKKTILITIAMGLILLITLNISVRAILLEKFAILQNNESEKNMIRISEVMSGMQNDLNIISGEYSIWDDTVSFIKEQDPGYINNNLPDSVFENLGLNLMLFIDNKGKVKYSKFYDLTGRKEIAFPEEFLDYFSVESNLLKHSNANESSSGIINLVSGPVMFVSNPVFKSDATGPSAGSLVIGFYIDKRIAGKLKTQFIQMSILFTSLRAKILIKRFLISW